MTRVWIDIENPPQVGYLLPLGEAFRELGAEVRLTARDHGITTQLLGRAGVTYDIVGRGLEPSRLAKIEGVVRRAVMLAARVRSPRPDLLVTASRPSALAARALGVPSFMVCDYEHVELRSFRLAGSIIVHPDVIDPAAFRRRGFNPQRLIPFPGIKEHLTFARVDLASVPAHRFDGGDGSVVNVLLRPPSEHSHYHTASTTSLFSSVLDRLAGHPDARIVLAPRHPAQESFLDRCSPTRQPVVLRRPAASASLLRGVDLVVCAGGTMLREAAYVGVPAYSVLMSETGQVDRHLERCGRLHFIRSAEQTKDIVVKPSRGINPLPADPDLPRRLVSAIERRATALHRHPA